ncbi:MAG TPA: N-methyl-L-tryptophan oxidase, partial [Chthonomonadales bacterium]|nr:N-methyl-L-tryptophan oxidase [Chthonomonadales bacterium]
MNSAGVVIIGAGAVGAMAAWRLARTERRVTILEQFELDHDRGSSFGESRIVRRVYPDSQYTALMSEAFELWDDLQAAWPQEELLSHSGGIFFGPAAHPEIAAARQALAASGVDYEELSAQECERRFPAIALRPDELALYEPSMGYARASRCVRAAARLAAGTGATLLEGVTARTLRQREDGEMEVETDSAGSIVADKVILSAGPWTPELLKKLRIAAPLKVTRQPYVHLRTAAGDFTAPRFPVWIDAAALAYGFPDLGNPPGVKVGLHRGGAQTTPGEVDRLVRDCDRESVREYASTRLRGLTGEITYEKVCLYTNTPDEDFIIDELPGHPGCLVIAGLSGHGF